MQKAEGRWGNAPPNGRGLDSGEELRPPKKGGKDESIVHKNLPLTNREPKGNLEV
jgi:hypothetical protein